MEGTTDRLVDPVRVGGGVSSAGAALELLDLELDLRNVPPDAFDVRIHITGLANKSLWSQKQTAVVHHSHATPYA
jgi:hypothetical protein